MARLSRIFRKSEVSVLVAAWGTGCQRPCPLPSWVRAGVTGELFCLGQGEAGKACAESGSGLSTSCRPVPLRPPPSPSIWTLPCCPRHRLWPLDVEGACWSAASGPGPGHVVGGAGGGDRGS